MLNIIYVYHRDFMFRTSLAYKNDRKAMKSKSLSFWSWFIWGIWIFMNYDFYLNTVLTDWHAITILWAFYGFNL